MKEYIGIPVLVNLVSMIRSETVGAILLVDDEGEGRFYDSLAHQHARVIPSPAMALEILSSATQRGVAGLAAAVRSTRAATDLASSQFAPSVGDVSSLLICSSNFERAIISVTGRTWYGCCEKEIGSLAIRCAVLACALEQIANASSGSHDTETIFNWVDWNLLSLLKEPVVNATSAELYRKINSFFEEGHSKPLRELLLHCSGELVMNVVATAIERYQPRGIKSDSIISSGELSKNLELSYPLENIEDDPVFWKMRKWERINPKYKLMRQWRVLDSFQLVWDQRYWETDLKSLLSLGEQGSGLSLIKLDLDNFKSVNAHLGHGGGDEAIKIASKLLNSIALGVGEVYRRGGDEFVIIAPDLRGHEAKQFSEKIRAEIESAFLIWGGSNNLELCPTASIGIVEADYSVCFDELIQAADTAQQLAKESGKNISIYQLLTVQKD